MDDYQSLTHSKRECKYHVVFIPKHRRRALYAALRRHLGGIFRTLTQLCPGDALVASHIGISIRPGVAQQALGTTRRVLA